MTEYLAHSANKRGITQSMRDHLQIVADEAVLRAQHFGREDDARLAGLLHDIGKYSDRFLRRLDGLEKGLDHWSAGAWIALQRFGNIPVALAIQGHHIGLQCGDENVDKALDVEVLRDKHPLGLSLSETDMDVLYQRLLDDGFQMSAFADVGATVCETASAMLDTRMLFSALVDADFLDTANHFGNDRPAGIDLEPERALEILGLYMDEKIRTDVKTSIAVRQMREDLWNACIQAGDQETGIFTLTAPTGSGKTLAMLAFGLRHAIRNGLRRLVFVVPYLSIIDQTVEVYREIFEPHFGAMYVLDHHSMARWKQETEKRGPNADGEKGDEGRRNLKLLAENWDAPIVVTTSVQMLESLHANRPAACRKLANISKAVLLFDEVQTVPVELAVPTLKTLSRLADPRYKTTVVFATATQPAFSHLHQHVLEANENSGWKPREIANAGLQLFERARRVDLDWSRAAAPITWAGLAQEIARIDQALCIVNMRADAQSLVSEVAKTGVESTALLHLSTWMCPAHRELTLNRVRMKLDQGDKCILISTSCVEAGVHLDFSTGYRSLAGLPSIAQAAGRVNRNGLRDLERLLIFLPEDERYPDDRFVKGRVVGGACRQAKEITELLLRERGAARMQLDTSDLFDAFYRRLYSYARPHEMAGALQEAIVRQDYKQVAELYQLIDQDTVNVLVPYRIDNSLDSYNALAKEAREQGLSRGWMQRSKPLLVSLFRTRAKGVAATVLEAIPTAKGEPSSEWFLFIGDYTQYDARMGLMLDDQSGLGGV